MNVLDLQRREMFKPIIGMAAAAAIAGLVVFTTPDVPKANAPDAKGALRSLFTKSDRLALSVKGTACSQRGWPDFEQNCQFDLRQPADEMRTVRVLDLR